MKTKRKNIFKSLLALTLALIMVLGVAPLSEFAGVDWASLFAPKAEAEGNLDCLEDMPLISESHYTGNQGDSCVFNLNKKGLPGIFNRYYGNGNVGIDGTVYNNGFEVWIARWNGGDKISWASATFDIGGKYKTLTGKSSVIKGSANTTSYDTSVYFYNGETLLYSFRMTPDDYEKSFKVDVTGVSNLTVMVKDNKEAAGGTSFALYDLFFDNSYGDGEPPIIPSTAVEFNGHYYQVYDNSMTWTEAKEYCEKLGGHLVTITSIEENNYIKDLVVSNGKKNAYWLGASDSETEGVWKWVTGEPFEFSDWGTDEPNQDGEENYLELLVNAINYSLKWNDSNLNGGGGMVSLQNHGFICEWDEIPEPGSNSDTLDTDGDGLPDVWEKEGLDYDGDGKIDVDLPAMGADPNVPDIFVEVDWMVRPQKKFLWWEIQAGRSMAPSEDAMKLVYESFKRHGINLHIDVGPDSIDFVTGKKWENLSGGNEIPYEKKFNIKSSWNSTVNANFSKARHSVFKHCLFVNQYDGTSSGKSNGIPGQFFIVANQDWVFNGGDISVGGTFMHELGHTLGLRHGGCDHEHYKPNYLSVMNYAFQTTGLVGSGMVGYSDYKLPDINEAHINENLGIDPSGLTAGTGLGTTLFYWAPNQRNVIPISKAAIDFNNNGKLETDISLDLNPDGNVHDKPIAELKGHEDWSGIVYKGGAIGEHNNSSNGNSSGIAFPINDTGLQEKTLEESLKTSTLASSGTGYIELLPSSLITDLNGQSLEFEVGNMSANETTFTVNIQCKSLFDSYTKSITISGSKDKIESERVIVPITKNVSSGEYTITCSLVSDDKSSDYTFSQEAVQVDKEDIEEMKKLLSEENELTDEEVSKIESVIEKYENAESNNICKLCGKNHGTSFFGKLTAFFHSVVYFLADILTAPFKLIIKLIKAIIGLFR